MAGYHLAEIKKGILGEFSKIKEEFEELTDAVDQRNKILQINELCDLIGAIEAYGEALNVSLLDLIQMKESTAGAFKSGHRQSDVREMTEDEEHEFFSSLSTNESFKDFSKTAMAQMGYIVTVEDGWVVKIYRTGRVEKLNKLK